VNDDPEDVIESKMSFWKNTTMLSVFFVLVRLTLIAVAATTLLVPCALSREPDSLSLKFGKVKCEGDYQGHLQGVCTDEDTAIYWSFTTQLVKTDPRGRVLKKIPVATHHGDLCFLNGKIYVAVNHGRFNDPQGNADSWVYVYDAETLELVVKHEIPEAFYGAGGIGVMDGIFYVVGGLPVDVQENYVYEFDAEFQFVKRHTIDSGYTNVGIQTATFHDGRWWFGCYGSPKIMLETDANFKLLGRHEFDCSLGIVGVAPDRLLVAKGQKKPTGRNWGSLFLARSDSGQGLAPISSP